MHIDSKSIGINIRYDLEMGNIITHIDIYGNTCNQYECIKSQRGMKIGRYESLVGSNRSPMY